jgi:arylsulfatase
MTMMKRAVSCLALAIGLAGPQPLLAQATAPAPAVAPAPVPVEQSRPNVLVWMMDDVGFAQVSSFGGLVETPNIDRVASRGLRYTNYHTAPICSAARASFLTGRMPHSVHIGGHSTAAMPWPSHDARIPANAGTVAANFRAAGYATWALGKWDHLPSEEASPAGPFTYWASGQGFERFYGFLAADADNWNPILVRDNTAIQRPQRRDYHLSADLADQAIALIGARDAAPRMRPFFLYFATGAAHAPHHAPADWIARYKGRFDAGWDKVRAEILKSQIARGLVPKGTKLAPRPEGLPAWDSLTPDAKRLYAHQMEVFAAALSYADAQFGRVLDTLEARGELDNTVVLVTSDNGASAEGGMDGLYNEAAVTSARTPDVADNLRLIEQWGGPRTYPHYSNGWAVAGDTPFRYFKQTAHEGGTRVPLIVSWPKGIAARGELRADFVHVSDVAPTLMDAAGVPLAPTVNDVPQVPMEGQTFKASFARPGNEREGRAQYVELYGNKGLWQQGWSIVTTHRVRTWDWNTKKTFDEPWELYDLVKDPGQTTDLAAKQPERVAAMAAEFTRQAKQYNVSPIFNLSDSMASSIGKARAEFARRGGKWRFGSPVSAVPSTSAPPIAALPFKLTAKLDLKSDTATGPVFSLGGQLGGIGLYLKQGRPAFRVNALDGTQLALVEGTAIGKGAQVLELNVGKTADGAYRIAISANGKVVVAPETELRMAVPAYFGISETFAVGNDDGSPVSESYVAGKPLDGVGEVVFDFSGSAPPQHGVH